MHLDIRYVTHFVYPTPVWESQNLLRACPIESESQKRISYVLEVEPAADCRWYIDRWGTRVDTFGVIDPHYELIVTVTTSVETTEPEQPSGGVTILDLYDETRDGRLWTYLHSSRHTKWEGPIVDVAGEVVAGSHDLISAIGDIASIVNGRLDYRPGATEIGVTPAAVWEQGAGVCQDYAHVTIAMLRSQGIPARYVSGYFYATDVAGGGSPDSAEITVQTHAWVEVWVPGFGWWAIDPTNDQVAGERHVTVGQGRDYDDVLPMRGVYYGDTNHALATHVVMSVAGLGARTIPEIDPELRRQIDQ
jgi:transglutaminase-like putative cysteine protease